MKKWQYGLIGALLLLLSAGYAWQRWPVAVYDTTYDTSETYAALTGTDSLSQDFTVDHNGLCGIQVRLALSSRESFDAYRWSVSDADGNELAAGTLAPEEADYKGDLKILFSETIQESKGKTYRFTISAEQVASEERSLTCYKSVGETGAGTVYLNGEAVEGSLMLKGILHYFDIETGIMSFVLLLYLAFFIRLMSKLFRN